MDEERAVLRVVVAADRRRRRRHCEKALLVWLITVAIAVVTVYYLNEFHKDHQQDRRFRACIEFAYALCQTSHQSNATRDCWEQRDSFRP